MNRLLTMILMLTSLKVFSANEDGILPCGEETFSEIAFIKREFPQYPRHMPIESVGGWVKLEIKVDQNGKAVEVIIVNSEPKRLFDRAARKSLLLSEFSKSEKQGLRCGIITIEFILED